MTKPNISSLQAARNWMDSLGMRSYGEVDLAIAKESAVDDCADRKPPSFAEPRPCAWQGVGFAAYASALLEDRSFLRNDLDRLIDKAEASAAGNRSGFNDMSQWCVVLQMAKDEVNSNSLPDADMQSANSGNSITQTDGNEIFRATIEMRMKPLPGTTSNVSEMPKIKDKTNGVVNIRLWI